MRNDINRWNDKYLDQYPDFTPDPLLIENRHLLDGNGMALDVACGTGKNALFLAELGYQVVAVDGSEIGIRHGVKEARRRNLKFHGLVMDLDQVQLPHNQFQLVIVFRYLNKALFPQLVDCLLPGGLLIYKTFNLNHLANRETFNKSFLLKNGELSKYLSKLKLIATNDSLNNKASASYFIGRR